MEIKNLDFGFPLILIDNFYLEEELNFIWEELNFLCDKNIFFSQIVQKHLVQWIME